MPINRNVLVAALNEVGIEVTRIEGSRRWQLESLDADPKIVYKALAIAGLTKTFEEWVEINFDTTPASRGWFRRHGYTPKELP